MDFDAFFKKLDSAKPTTRSRYPHALLEGAARRINAGEKTAREIARALLKLPEYKKHTESALVGALTRAARRARGCQPRRRKARA